MITIFRTALCFTLLLGAMLLGPFRLAGQASDSLLYRELRRLVEESGYDKYDLRRNEEFLRIVRKNGLDLDRLVPLNPADTMLTRPVDSLALLASESGVAMLARAYGDSIVLRWAPNNPLLWVKANAAGYTLERYVIDDSLGLLRDSLIYLAGGSGSLIRPWAMETIRAQLTRADTLPLIAAQMLYDSSYIGAEEDVDVIEKYRHFQNRFGFALLAADRSPRAADLLGLRFVDRNVIPGWRYAYMLRTPADTSLFSTPVVPIRNQPAPLAPPADLVTQPGDHLVTLYWNKNANREFTTFLLERSENNGATFRQLSNQPLLFPETGEVETENFLATGEPGSPDYRLIDLNGYYVFHDSVPENYQNYIYRLRGINSFGETSPFAEVQVQARDLTPPSMPQITEARLLEDGRAYLRWENPVVAPDLAGFRILEATESLGNYSPLHSEWLPPGASEYTTREVLSDSVSHYYKVEVRDDKGNSNVSFPVYVHVVDSLPPAPPVNIRHFIDTTGVLTLGWDPGPEPDLAGYRVYFSNSLQYEFTQLTEDPLEYNFFIDTLEINTLTEKAYYMIQAVDISHNRSDFSEVVEVQKPDIIPPVVPVPRQPEMSDSSIVLHWLPSSSDDVIAHVVYRRLAADTTDWQQIAALGPADSTFVDRTALPEQLYEYTLRARDDAGLYSDYAFPVKARRWFADELLLVSGLTAAYDPEAKAVQVQWQYTPPAAGPLARMDFRFYLYRAVNEEPIERYRQLNGDTRSFADTAVKTNEPVNYAIKVVFRNGKASPISETIRVTPTE